MKRRSFLRASAVASIVGFAGCLGNPEYTVSSVQVDDSPGPLDLSVTTVDPNATVEGPARFAFRLRNPTQKSVAVRSMDVWPFGVLALTTSPPRSGSSTGATSTPSMSELTLYSPSYAKSGHVTVSGNRQSMGADTTRISRRLTPGETAQTVYLLHGEDVYTTGTYYVTVWSGLQASRYMTNGKWSKLPLSIAIDIERKKRFPV